ncbi:hypothetical protein VNO77_05184 [Canavalia gladiata]|uniref:Uncharacterized protein n=1 Tax=Canavalia gladiata TaxID=3824 RepID=A0AAN9MXW0_CANGL
MVSDQRILILLRISIQGYPLEKLHAAVFKLWPYIKLMVIFCLITPDFGRASCVYDNIIRPYISRNPQAIIFRLSNSRKFSVKKDKFLLYAERDIKENGTEALEKFIASKGTTYKPDAEGTNVVRAIDNEEVQQTGKKLQTEHKDIKDLEDILVMPNLAPSQKWSCALCKFTSTSKKTLNDHLYGRKHRATWEGVSEKNQPVGKNRFKLRCPICNVTCGGVVDMNSHLNGRKHLTQVTDFNLK